MMPELFLLCGGRTEEGAKRVVDYLKKEFPMAVDSGLTIRQVTKDDPPFFPLGKWIGVIPDKERWEKYTTTITNMRAAAKDYESGWKDAKNES